LPAGGVPGRCPELVREMDETEKTLKTGVSSQAEPAPPQEPHACHEPEASSAPAAQGDVSTPHAETAQQPPRDEGQHEETGPGGAPARAGASGANGSPEHTAAAESAQAHTPNDSHSETGPGDAAEGETAEVSEPAREIQKDWYILKVQSNREESIREGLLRRIAIAGLQDFFGEIIVPFEMRSEFKNGRKRVFKQKLYPGYLVVNMEINDDTWFLVRETPGIGDFTGTSGKPSPMQPHEVAKILAKQEEKTDEAPKLKINFSPGDRVKITEGTFENFEGDVDSIDEANGRVTVMINIFGRSTPVELEYWQIESL
jgi:transcriptional antiterminator NusG